MSDEGLNPVPLRHHLVFLGLIVGLVTLIGVFFTRHPITCQVGYRPASTGQTQVCVKADAGG